MINNDIVQNAAKRMVGYGYAGDATVSTPNASYTVKELIALIDTAQEGRMAVDSNTIGKASSTLY